MSPKRCVLKKSPDIENRAREFYPDSGGYLQIFGPYPDYDIYLKKKKKKKKIFLEKPGIIA